MLQDIDLVNWKSCATNQFGRKEIGKKKKNRKEKQFLLHGFGFQRCVFSFSA